MQSFLSCQDTLLRTPPGPPTQAVTEGTAVSYTHLTLPTKA